VCTAAAFVVFFALIAEVGPTRATVITYVNPAVAILLGVVVLDEKFTLGMAIGFPLVILGSILATARVRRRRGDTDLVIATDQPPRRTAPVAGPKAERTADQRDTG
jgi:hypothetical protein